MRTRPPRRRAESAPRRASAACGECPDPSEHCHGPLVLHVAGWYECGSGRPCSGALALHGEIVKCDELGACGCADASSG